MPIEKYLVTIDETVVALKYDVDKRIITLGGNFRFRNIMLGIINNGFQRHPSPEPEWPQRNKMRFTFRKDREGFDEGIIWLRENGYVVEVVSNHGHIMR